MTTRCLHLSRAGPKQGQRRQYGTKTVSQHEALRFATRLLWGLNAIGGGNCATNKNVLDGVRYQLVLLWPMTNDGRRKLRTPGLLQ